MKKCIKKNLYAAVDVMAVVTLLLLVAAIAKKDETLGKCFFGSLTVTGALGLAQMMFGHAKIENESGTVIHTKSEEGCDAVELSPGGARYDIDGVNTQGKVYKLSDGCHAVARKDGTVKVKSLTGKFVNSVMGGVLVKAPDSCWDELFKA
ncbi:MAG: hypothetical protein IKU01_02435 [Bacteroidales bacterium]|nr:hypothetical protein [Bacteroidales bacterium]